VFYPVDYFRSCAVDFCSGGTQFKSWPGYWLLLLKPGSVAGIFDKDLSLVESTCTVNGHLSISHQLLVNVP
jgi:hypothetical protein